MMNLDLSTVHLMAQKSIPETQKAKTLKALKEKTDEFEAILVKTLLDVSIKENKNSIFTKEVGHDIYRSMYHEQLSKQLSGSFGYSDLLYDFLRKSI